MTTGKELRDFMNQAGINMQECAFILDGVNDRTVRAWCGAPNKRYKAVPEWVIPRLSEALGRVPHPVVDKFVVGQGIQGRAGGAMYLIHTQSPRFCCIVSDVDKFVESDDGPVFACGKRAFHNFLFFDMPLDGIKPVLDQASQILDDRHK